MATTTITISSVECHLISNYRSGTGNPTFVAQYVVCPTAIECPSGIQSYTYNLTLTGVDSLDSSCSYEYTGNISDSIIGFTQYNPSWGTSDGDWQDSPVGFPRFGTQYLAILPEGHYGDNYVTYTLAGTVTFEHPIIENYSIENKASNVEYRATLQQTEATTNKLSFGGTTPTSLYYGSSPVQEVYLGSTLLYSTSLSPTTEYGINIQLLGPSIGLEDSRYTSAKINGVTLEVDTQKKVGSTNLTVTVVSGAVIAPTTIDIYAWIPGVQTDMVCTMARINGYLKCSSSTVVKATWSWSDIVVAEW